MMQPALVVALHGVGAWGRDMNRMVAGLSPALVSAMPGVAFSQPDAPFPFDGGRDARQWFSVAGVTAENRPGRVAAARAAFDAVLEREMAAHGLAGRPDRVALAGFSQGAIMALDALASGRWPVAGVVAFCGRLAIDDMATALPKARALLIHGQEDGVISCLESERAAARLTGCGADVTCRIVPRLGHDFSPAGLQEAAEFLAESLSV